MGGQGPQEKDQTEKKNLQERREIRKIQEARKRSTGNAKTEEISSL